MKKTLKDFTPEIQAKIPEYIGRAMQGVSDRGRYNNFSLDKAIECVNWNYEKSGFKKPMVIVAENPLEMQLLFNFVKMLMKDIDEIESVLSQLDSQLYSQLRSQLGSQLGSQLYSQLYSQLDSQLYSQLGSQLYSQLDSQLYSQLRSQLGSQLGSQLYSQLGSQLDSQLDLQLRSQLGSQLDSQLDLQRGELYNYNNSYLFTMNFYSDCYYAWYEFIRKEFGIELSINYDFQECFKLQRESGICQAIFSEALCVVSKYPKKVHWNNQDNMSNTNSVAVEWGSFSDHTIFDCYYVNGINLPKDIFEKVRDEKLTQEEFFKIDNEETKSGVVAMMQEKFGENYLFEFFREVMTKVDTYTDNKNDKYLEGTTKGMNIGVYTLFKGSIDENDIAYVRCYCPSTDRMFFLGVEPHYNTAKDAIASLYRVPRKLSDKIKYIQRQGERFSTVFTDDGTILLKSGSLSKEDIQDTVTISGDEYFAKMRYEY